MKALPSYCKEKQGTDVLVSSSSFRGYLQTIPCVIVLHKPLNKDGRDLNLLLHPAFTAVIPVTPLLLQDFRMQACCCRSCLPALLPLQDRLSAVESGQLLSSCGRRQPYRNMCGELDALAGLCEV